MPNFSTVQYSGIVTEIRDRILSADTLSGEKNTVFIESTSLQIRKILELVAYLSVLVNRDKLNHDDRNQYRANIIVDQLNKKTTVFYPLPSHMIHPKNNNEQPTLIPLGYTSALSQSDFKDAYQLCGEVLHAQHPLKKKQLDVENVFYKNKEILKKIKNLLQQHTIGIMQESNKYTFLYVQIDFTNNSTTKPSFIREYNSHIFNESELISIFNQDIG